MQLTNKQTKKALDITARARAKRLNALLPTPLYVQLFHRQETQFWGEKIRVIEFRSRAGSIEARSISGNWFPCPRAKMPVVWVNNFTETLYSYVPTPKGWEMV